MKLHQTREKKNVCSWTWTQFVLNNTMNSGFPEARGRTWVSLETERADKSQLNKGSNNNTGRFDCVTLQWWVWGVWVYWINHNLPVEMSDQSIFCCFIRLQHYKILLKITQHNDWKIEKWKWLKTDIKRFSIKMCIIQNVAKTLFWSKCSVLTSQATSVA